MAKYYGKIGYGIAEETTPGVWTNVINERFYYGDIIKNYKKAEQVQTLNDNINVNNQISIISDPYAMENFHHIKSVEFMGTKWKVTSVDVEFPRLILTLGGVYNGQ